MQMMAGGTFPPGESVFQYCVRRGLGEVVRLLLRHGAEANQSCDGSGMYPWEISVAHGHGEITRMLGEYLPVNSPIQMAARKIGWALRMYLLHRHRNSAAVLGIRGKRTKDKG